MTQNTEPDKELAFLFQFPLRISLDGVCVIKFNSPKYLIDTPGGGGGGLQYGTDRDA